MRRFAPCEGTLVATCKLGAFAVPGAGSPLSQVSNLAMDKRIARSLFRRLFRFASPNALIVSDARYAIIEMELGSFPCFTTSVDRSSTALNCDLRNIQGTRLLVTCFRLTCAVLAVLSSSLKLFCLELLQLPSQHHLAYRCAHGWKRSNLSAPIAEQTNEPRFREPGMPG